MSKQVLSIEQMHHLKELGVDTSKATFCVNVADEDKHIFTYDTYYSLIEYSCETHPVFTLQDILDLLPATVDDDYRLYIDKGLVLWTVGYVDAVSEEIYEDFRERDLIDAAYEMLCWVVENGYLEV